MTRLLCRLAHPAALAVSLVLLAPVVPRAAEQTLPVLLSRAVSSARQGDLASSRKHLKTFLATKPGGAMNLRARLGWLAVALESAAPDLDEALKLCLSLGKRAELKDSFELLYCRGLVYQRLAARELAKHSCGEPELRPLVEPGADWRYFKGSAAPPSGWKTPEFDASGWLEGKAGFGYGDEDDATELADMQGKYPSVFLRRDFELPGAAAGKVDALLLRVRFDDGFIACLNGSELARANVPGRRGEAVPHDVTANGQNEADKWEDYIVGSDGLRPGRNTLTIQAHNYTLPSSDFSIEASLAAAAHSEDPAAEASELLAKAAADLGAAGKAAGPGSLQLQAAVELAVIRILAGDLDDAERELLEVERRLGQGLKTRIVYLRAWIFFRRGRLLEAGRLLARLAPFSRARSGHGVLYLLGRVHHGLGELREAEAFYRLVLGGTGERELEHVAAARLALGAVLVELGENTEAEKLLEEPRGESPPTTRQLFGRLLYGVSLVGGGKLATARNSFLVVARAALDKELRSRALFWAGRCSVLRWEKGGSWMRKNLSKAAIDYLDRGLFLKPGASLDGRIAVELGEALLRFDRPAEAEKVWRRLRASGGGTGMTAAYGLLVSLQGAGHHSQAIELARELLKLYPASPDHGALLQRLGDSLLLNGISAPASNVRRERFGSAAAVYARALASPGVDSRLTIRFRRGVALLLLGDFQAARKILSGVVKSAAQSSDAVVRSQTAFAAGLLGRLYLMEGEQAAADAFSAAKAVENLEKAGRYLEEFRLNAEAPSELRTRAELAHGYSLRLRAGLLADPAEKKKLLAEARGLLSITARRLEHKPPAIRANLELARVLALSAGRAQGTRRLTVFTTRSPWKESTVAAEALLELARQQAGLGRFPQAFAALDAAAARALPSLLTLVKLDRARLKARQGETGAARLFLAALYQGSYETRVRGLAALELLRLESSRQVGDRARKLLRETIILLATEGEGLNAELRADLLLEIVRLEAAGVHFRKSASIQGSPLASLSPLRAMTARDDRRAVASLIYEAGALLESGNAERALALAEDAYSFSREPGLENDALLARGICLLVSGRTSQAVKTFEELASTVRDKRPASLCLAVAHTRLGDIVKSRQSFQAARAGGPGDPGFSGGLAPSSAAIFKETLARLQALSLKPDDNAVDTAIQLARLFFCRPLKPAERRTAVPVAGRAAALTAEFLAETRLLGLKPLPYVPLEGGGQRASGGWMELAPQPMAPAPGGTPGNILGQVLRAALTADPSSVEGERR